MPQGVYIRKGNNMTNKEIRECSHCGGKIVEYIHTLNKLLIISLQKFADVSFGKEMRLSRSGLTHTQITNFQKLRYWDLVRKGENAGCWKITQDGTFFLTKDLSMPEKVKTFRGKAVGYGGDLKTIKNITGYLYKNRETYAKEAVPVIGADNNGEQVKMFSAPMLSAFVYRPRSF